MVRISQIGLCLFLMLFIAAPMGYAYVATFGEMTTYGAHGAACPPAGCPPHGMLNPFAAYGMPPQAAPFGHPPITKCKPPITKCKPPMPVCGPPPGCMPPVCPPPMCAPSACAPMPCGPVGCAPMPMRPPPVKWY